MAKSASPSLLKSVVVMPSGMLSPLPTATVDLAKLRALSFTAVALFVTAVTLSEPASFPAVS
jgi:hypothetical protein